MHQPALMTLGAEGHPLIDFDFTVFIQFGIFAVTALIATRWLFKPYLRMREARAEGIEGGRKEAETFSAEADARLADYQAKLAAARSRALDEQRAIRGEAVAHERELTAKARGEATRALDEAQARVASETESARADLLPRADAIASEIAAKLLGRKVA